MTTVKCPKCDEQVRMPADASAEASVQCPLCAEEFELSVALDRLAPMLVVLNDPGAAYSNSSAGKNTFSATALVAEDDRQTASPEFSFADSSTAGASTPAFAFEDGSAANGTAGSVSSRRARSQRPQKSAVKEIIKVVGGGVIGLTIGQLILWWLPGSLKKDPFELGPPVSRYVWFLVSPPFRDPTVASKDDESEPRLGDARAATAAFNNFGSTGSSELPSSSFEGMLDPNDIPSGKKKKKKNRANQTSVADDGSTSDATAPDGSQGQTSSDDGSVDPLEPLATEDDIFGGKPELVVPMINLESFPTPNDPTPAKEPDPGSDDSTPNIPPSVEPKTTPDAPTTTSPPTAATGDFAGVRNAPQISSDQLSTRLSGAVSASIAMDTSATEPVAKQLTLAREFYLTLAGLGEAITFVDQAAATNQVEEVGKFALEVGRQSAKLDLIGKVAPSWMKNSRPHNGLVVCGTVESIEFAAPYYVTSLVMPNKSVLKVVSINDPSGDYQPQNKVLVLGSILEAPQQNLKDYQGEATMVVVDGLHATLPSAE